MLVGSGVLAVLVAVVLLAVALGVPVLSRSCRVELWAASRGLVLTEGNRPMVRYYLRTARVLRFVGGLAGLVLPLLVARAWTGRSGIWGLSGVAWVYVGYLLGSLYAEVAVVRPASNRRAASLSERRLPHYLPAHLLWTQRGLAALVVAGGVVALRLEPGFPRWLNGRGMSTAAPVWVAVLAIAVPVIVEMLERWVVRRPQPLGRPDLVAADDAIRSQSLHSLCGSGLALLVLLASAQAAILGQRAIGDLRRPAFAAAAGLVLASWLVCLWFGHRRFHIRRPQAVPA